MQEYYFLFALAFAYTIFATIQDIKAREVANWLNFSFIAFALAYRAFYSITNKNLQFMAFGIIGFAIFFLLAQLFYYSRVFAGGDAKLLIGYGIILPYTSYKSFLYLPITFIILLFTIGAVYSLTYSIFIVLKNKKTFKKEFLKQLKKHKFPLIALSAISLLSVLALKLSTFTTTLILLTLILLTYIYTKTIDTCMISSTPPSKLTEGDWLIDDIKLKNKTIKKTVHGLSLEDIKLLRKSKKRVFIKEGIPFTPVFLISLIAMVFFFLTSKVSPEQVLSSLLSQLSFLP